MALALYLIFLGGSCAFALVDWRRAWYLVMVCGVIQDPVRKLTAGNSVAISFAVVILYACILFGARDTMRAHMADFSRRFGSVHNGIFIFIFLLLVAALNGLMTYGFDKWIVPLVSLITYTVPLIAALLGYAWLQREEDIMKFFRFYATITAIAMLGTPLEYFRLNSRILGMVSFEGDYIRHLPGIQIRMLSGIYRSPDVMAWHAGMLTAIGIALALRAGLGRQMLIWSGVAGWGFFCCMIAGRRKAIYFVAVFTAVFLWRYIRRVKNAQVFAALGLLFVAGAVINHLSGGEATSVYTRGAMASQEELGQRLEGGVMETFREFGYMGAGLGTATQGVHHLLGGKANVGWQEGGLGKLAIEVGLPGIVAIVFMAVVVIRVLLQLTAIPDVTGSSQFIRVMLFGLVAANIAGFIASAQAFTDAMLALTTGFLVGGLFATAALDERLPPEEAEAMVVAAQASLTPQHAPL